MEIILDEISKQTIWNKQNIIVDPANSHAVSVAWNSRINYAFSVWRKRVQIYNTVSADGLVLLAHLKKNQHWTLLLAPI